MSQKGTYPPTSVVADYLQENWPEIPMEIKNLFILA